VAKNARRQAMLEAALQIVGEEGCAALTHRRVAERAGVSLSATTYYFRSKEEVLETIFRETWSGLVRETERIEVSGVPFREQLRRFARIYLGSWLVTPELVTVLVREIARSGELQNRIEDVREAFAHPPGLLQPVVAVPAPPARVAHDETRDPADDHADGDVGREDLSHERTWHGAAAPPAERGLDRGPHDAGAEAQDEAASRPSHACSHRRAQSPCPKR